MIKYYLIVAVFLIFVVLAFYVYFRYYIRVQIYTDLSYICRYLKNNISFKKDTLDSIIQNSNMHISSNTRRLLSYKKTNNLLLKKEDLNIMQIFQSSLGKGDVNFEINNLNYYSQEFEDRLKTSKESLQKNGVVYLKIIIGFGLCFCIMLL